MKDSSSFMSGAPLEYQPLTQADNGEKGKIINKTSNHFDFGKGELPRREE